VVIEFAGFELDQQRAELRRPDGRRIKLRPKALEMLQLFAANAGRVLSKQELMEAVWPNIHVAEDSLFQCIREIRAALGDDRREMIKLVSGRGYAFEIEASTEPADVAAETEGVSPALTASAEPAPDAAMAVERAKPRWSFGLRGPAMAAALAGLCAVVGFAAAAPIFRPDLIFGRSPPTVAVMPIVDVSGDDQGTITAAAVTERLIDGLARIGNIRVVAPPANTAASPAEAAAPRAALSDFSVYGELRKEQQSWTLQARMIRTATREIQAVATVSVDIKDADAQLQQSRLAAGAGHPLALRLNALLEAGLQPTRSAGTSRAGGTKVVIEQATASIHQTTRERFAAAQTMLETAIAADPDNGDLAVALAELQLRGIQLAWYDPAKSAAAETSARSTLERALRARPGYIPVLEAYCRFLATTNQFVESLVACAKTLSFDPWNGLALFNIGLAQYQLGRFTDGLASFELADQFDTPQVSRWTWLLGAGVANMLLGRNEDAVRWLQRSIAITPASGRTHLLLAAAYQKLGRTQEAKAALEKALELRPGTTVLNFVLPTRNASPVFLAASEDINRTLVELGLPER
jgi:DNA-binding winged helix-turn-helix (wHTH) protein/tetratricopeptide (TPR) repeat protein/TolB-like protein